MLATCTVAGSWPTLIHLPWGSLPSGPAPSSLCRDLLLPPRLSPEPSTMQHVAGSQLAAPTQAVLKISTAADDAASSTAAAMVSAACTSADDLMIQ